ncbi:MAG: nitroreductase family protein [Hyphomonas sp.]|nr:nitroreductase family protein [Hyphomonas sp.]
MFNETPQEAWLLRYGSSAPDGLPDLGSFLNHRSVRHFTGEPISFATIRGLIAAAQSAATSSNLQLWTVISVQEPERRNRLAVLCANQSQIVEASWFLTFHADLSRLDQLVPAESALSTAEFYTMAVIDAALAAERLVCAAESLGIGICYIGALRNDVFGVREELALPPFVAPLFGLCLGYPDLSHEAEVKPRLAQEVVWHQETYRSGQDWSDYDERMVAFYQAQGMNPQVNWSMRSGRRGTKGSLTGREKLKPFLTDQGLDLE